MLDIIVPVYNEKENIKNLLDQIDKHIKVKKRITIIYDYNDDNTLPVVKRIHQNYKFSICLKKNIYGHGALNAIKTGLHTFESNVALVLMADLSDSLEVVDQMYNSNFAVKKQA